jgi:hypothetical protein
MSINKTALIQTNLSGDTQIVAAVPGHRIRVLSFVLTASGNENIKFRSDTTDITGTLYLGTHGSLSSPSPIQTPAGIQYQFQTNSGEALNVNLSGTSNVGGYAIYQVIRE